MRALMSRISHRGFARFVVVLLGGLPLVIGCSGGDDGGGVGLSYSGLTTPVVIGQDNAQGVLVGAYTGGSVGGPLSVLGVAQPGGGASTRQSSPLVLSHLLGRALAQVSSVSPFGQVAGGAVVSETERVDGGCGGHVIVRIDINDETGEFTGSLAFNGFCEEGAQVGGAASMAGQADLATGDIAFLMTTSGLSVAFEGVAFTLAGEIDTVYSGSSVTLNMNTLTKDDRTGKVFRAEDYEVTVVEAASSVQETVSGRFYHPDYGYVDLSTQTPFRTNSGDIYPSSGALLATGEGQTKARLTALSSTTLRIEADTDGNGDYDYDSGALNWVDV